MGALREKMIEGMWRSVCMPFIPTIARSVIAPWLDCFQAVRDKTLYARQTTGANVSYAPGAVWLPGPSGCSSTATTSSILRIDDTWTNNQAPGTWKNQGLRAAISSEQITVGPKGKMSKRPLYMEMTLRDG